MAVIITVEEDIAALVVSAINLKKHGWGSIEGIIAAHIIETVKEHRTIKI